MYEAMLVICFVLGVIGVLGVIDWFVWNYYIEG